MISSVGWSMADQSPASEFDSPPPPPPHPPTLVISLYLVFSMTPKVLIYLLSLSELIIMSDGENIPPVPIEDRIKNEIPFLSNVMVVGDQREFLTCLMTLKV